MDNYIFSNEIQKKYRSYLHKKFSNTNSYEEFIEQIANELKLRFGILDWAFAFLNLPDKLVVMENFGTVHGDYVAQYLERKLYKHDLILHHSKLTNLPVFQSDVIHAVESSTHYSYDSECYKILYSENINHGFKEVYCIPVTSSIDGSKCLFTVTSRYIKGSTKGFKKSASKNKYYFMSLAIAINDIGFMMYKDDFLRALKEYGSIFSSKSLRLLSVMVEHDVNLKEGAKILGIAHNTAKTHIARLKQSLGATTVHGAFYKAQQCELIT